MSLRPRVSGLETRISNLAPPYLRVGVPVSRVWRPVSLTLSRLAHAWRAVSRIWIYLLFDSEGCKTHTFLYTLRGDHHGLDLLYPSARQPYQDHGPRLRESRTGGHHPQRPGGGRHALARGFQLPRRDRLPLAQPQKREAAGGCDRRPRTGAEPGLSMGRASL